MNANIFMMHDPSYSAYKNIYYSYSSHVLASQLHYYNNLR